MRAAKIVLFLLCVVTGSTQTFRHFYVRFLDKNESVMDKYRTGIEAEIYDSSDINQLEKLYIDNKEKIEKIMETDENYEDDREYKNLTTEKKKITDAIYRAENLDRSRRKLMIYWTLGLISVIFGCVSYFFTSRWISLAALITGFSEMLVWTSPFFDRHNTINFIELLNMKLILSAITVVLIISIWLLNEKFIDRNFVARQEQRK